MLDLQAACLGLTAVSSVLVDGSDILSYTLSSWVRVETELAEAVEVYPQPSARVVPVDVEEALAVEVMVWRFRQTRRCERMLVGCMDWTLDILDMAAVEFSTATIAPTHCYVFAVACSLWDWAVVGLYYQKFFDQAAARPQEVDLRVIANMGPK